MNTSFIHLGIAALVLVLAAGGYALGFHMVSEAKAEATTLAGEIAAKEAAQARGAGARARLLEVASDETFLASHFVATADIVSFLEDLEGAGDAFGAVVSVASVSGDEANQGGRITLSLSIRGSFDAVMRTLGVLEHGRYVLSSRDLVWSGGAEGEWAVTGTFVAETKTTTP